MNQNEGPVANAIRFRSLGCRAIWTTVLQTPGFLAGVMVHHGAEFKNEEDIRRWSLGISVEPSMEYIAASWEAALGWLEAQ